MATVRKIQAELSDVTGSMASLESWEPHVTIGDGVELKEGELEKFLHEIESLATRTTSFRLELRDIATMDNWVGGDGEKFTPYVIYLDVKLNEEFINVVKQVSNISTDLHKWYLMPKPYLPHCTLAFRDLTEDGLRRGVEYLKQQSPALTTSINHIALVEMLPERDRELVRFNFAKKL